MGIPVGTEYIIPIVVNKNLIAGDIDKFLYTIDITNYRSTIEKFITSDIGTKTLVYDPETDTVLTKYIDFVNPTQGENLIINFVSSTIKSKNKKFLICFGNTLSNTQYGSVYSEVNYTNYWYLNQTNIQYPVRNTINGTPTGLQTRVPGLIDYCVYNNGVGTGRLMFDNELIGTGNRTVDIIYKCMGLNAQGVLVYNSKFAINFNTNGSLACSSNLISFLNTRPGINTLNVWHYLTVTRKSDGATTIYLDGTRVTSLDSYEAGTPAVGTTSLSLLNNGDTFTIPCNAYVCQFGITNNIQTPEFIKTRSNMFLLDEFFAIDGVPYSNQMSSGLSIGF